MSELQTIVELLTQLVTKDKLGFGPLPEQMIYIGREHGGLWYEWNGEGAKIIEHPALNGYLQQIELAKKEYKGKETDKLRISINAGTRFTLQTSLESVFAKGFLEGLLALGARAKEAMLTIVPQAGSDEKVVLCTLYADGERVRANWSERSGAELYAEVQQMLGGQANAEQPGSEQLSSERINNLRDKLDELGLSEPEQRALLVRVGARHFEHLTLEQAKLLWRLAKEANNGKKGNR